MKRFVYLFLLLSTLTLNAQGEANNWYFGLNAGLDFNGTDPLPISGMLSTNEGCATFSDKDGKLLFYTDGLTVWNRVHDVMPGGTGLLGNPSSTQSGIIVPHPGEAKKFYIFTVGASFNESLPGLNGYVVDMASDNGLGAVVEGPIDLSDGKSSIWTEKVTSVKAAECHAFWVISLVGNTYYSYKIDENGLNETPVLSPVSKIATDVRGYLKVSPDGTKLATATFNTQRQQQTGTGSLMLNSFNDMTGEVLNNGIGLITETNRDGEPYGVEFSPSSNMLYVSTFDAKNTYKLFQFDMEASNIPGSKQLIHTEGAYRGGLQLAPNGKIYATIPPDYNNGTSYLDVINFPDEKGTACNFKLNAIDLGSGQAMQGLPPFIASILLPVEITDGISTVNINNTTVKRCIGDDYHISAQNIEGDPTYKWIYKDSIISTQPVLDLLNLSKDMEGNYAVEIETVDECDFKIAYKGEINLEIYQPPTINTLSDIEQCDDDNDGKFNFDLSALKDEEVFSGQDTLMFEVKYFTNRTDAEDDRNAISDTYINESAFSHDMLYARIHNIENPICYEIEPFNVKVYELPDPPASIEPLEVCDSEIVGTDVDGFEQFNLTDKTDEISNGQNPADFQITYFWDANHQNPISDPTIVTNTTKDRQTIFIQIKNIHFTNCIVNTSFEVIVNKRPDIIAEFTLKQCDEDGVVDGFTDFNLNEINDFLTKGVSGMEVTHYLDENHAENKINSIPSLPYNNQTQNYVFARIENEHGCYRVSRIDLVVSATSFPADYLKVITDCDDDDNRDGKRNFDLSPYTSEIIQLFPSGQNLEVSYFTNLTDAQLETNAVGTDGYYFNETPFDQTLFVRVESLDNGECFGLGPYVQLIVEERPDFELDSTAIYCQNLPPITVSTGNPTGDFSYAWYDENGAVISNTKDAVIAKEGKYTVIATSQYGCESFPHVIDVQPSIIATLNYNDLTIEDDSLNNSILINTANLGVGDYEYAINEPDGPYQDEPFFDGLLPGIHTLFIRDKNNCGTLATDVSVLGYPKFFTPNNDGANDKWAVLGVSADFYQSAIIYVFDRFGKLVAHFDLKGDGWDGSFNGELLPANDYWFTVNLVDLNGNTRAKKGHFSLIRR